MPVRMILVLRALLLSTVLSAQGAELAPRLLTYKQVGSQALQAHVFDPGPTGTTPRSAIVLFHGGGWTDGEAAWVYPAARRFAALGLVAVAIDYRLSDGKTTTPLDAMADARDAIRWVRGQAGALRLAPQRVAAYGVSAGGHLAAAAALIGPAGGPVAPEARPDALLLLSPAVALSESGWARKQLRGQAPPEAISPDHYVKAGLPPILLNQGTEDLVTPFQGALHFARSLRAAGNRCELRPHSSVGHLLTRNLDEQEWAFDTDPVTRMDVARSEAAFLATLGFIAPQPPAPESPEATVRGLAVALDARDRAQVKRRLGPGATALSPAGSAPSTGPLLEALERDILALPEGHLELHAVSVNGAFVTARERVLWAGAQGTPRRRNRLLVFEVQEGQVVRMWAYPAQD